MNALASEQQQLQQLRILYGLRDKRAQEAVSEQRLELDRVLGKLAEQKALLLKLRDELSALHNMRSRTNIEQMSAQSLQAESDRRRWLLYDLEQEEFYLPGFESDVHEARVELALRQRAWTRARERLKALDQQDCKIKSRLGQARARAEDAMLDERPTTGLNNHG